VPDVARAPGIAATAITLLTGDTPGVLASPGPLQWGLFAQNGGAPVVTADNCAAFEFRQDWNLPTYPMENGAFGSYNKVWEPFTVRLRFSTGGSIADKNAFLASIQAIAGNLVLYSAITPEATYPSVNVDHYDYRRADGKAGLLIVDVWCEQISQTGSVSYGNTISPSGAPQQNGGTVQTTTPTAAQLATLLPT
jgi:hypothetical protein